MSNALQNLRVEHPLGNLTLTNDEGRNWQQRMNAADAAFRDYSYDWKENQELLTGFRSLIDRYGTHVALGFAIQQSFIADTYFGNPDPYVQDLRSGSQDVGNILSDVFRALMKKSESERYMKEGFQDQWWAGFGLLWPSYHQEAYERPSRRVVNMDGSPRMEIVPTKQDPLVRRVSPWRVRFDPDGRDWNLSDHNWISVDYWQTMAQAMADRRYSEEDKARLAAFFSTSDAQQGYHAANVRYSAIYGGVEQDPRYIRILCREIWAKPERKIYYKPLGAEFVMGDGAEIPNDWPEEYADADTFPAIYLARNRQTEDESGLTGFIGVPDIRLIKPQLYNIQRLDSLFTKANRVVIPKLLSRRGALDPEAQRKLEDSDKYCEVIEVDDDAFAAPNVSLTEKVSVKDILWPIPQVDFKELHMLEGIRHNIQIIWQIIGQGPADRGGQAEASSATESLGMQRGLQRRMSYAKALGRHYFVELCKRFYLMIKSRQTLPIWYQRRGKTGAAGVWAQFSADMWADLELNFDCTIGESDPRTREEEVAIRRQAAEVLLPIYTQFNDRRRIEAIGRMLVEPLNIVGLDELFDDELLELAKQLYAIDAALHDDVASADDLALTARKQELTSAIVSRILADSDIQQIESGGAQPSAGGQGSLPAAPSPGEAAAEAGAMASAAAGMIGGMR
jgi:hypothetical protein